jgi:protein subunit release factor A
MRQSRIYDNRITLLITQVQKIIDNDNLECILSERIKNTHFDSNSKFFTEGEGAGKVNYNQSSI